MITEKRADGKVETEATIKIWVEGQRYVRTAEGNGPVNALDRALRDAIGELHPHLADIELVDYKVRILDSHHGTGAVTRVLLDSSDGQRLVGLDRRLGEHHRGLLGGARRLARVRVPARTARRRPDRAGGPTSSAPSRSRSLAPTSASARRSWSLEVLRSGRLSLGPMLERFERAFADWLGVDDAVAVSSGTAALHLGVRALGWGEGDEVVTTPFSFVASANCLLYEGVTPVFCDVDPVTLNLDPAAAWDAVGRAHRRAPAGPHPRLPGGAAGSEAIAAEGGLGMLEDACEALGAARLGGAGRSARAGNLATFAFYANKQLTTGEGGMLAVSDRRRSAARLRSERNQGRAPDMSWVDHDRLGFNYRLTEIQAALGDRAARAARRDARRARPASRRLYGERLAALDYGAPAGEGDPDGLVLPCADRGRGAAELVRLRGPAAERGRPRRGDRRPRAAGRRGEGLHALHPPDAALRERFGFSEGQFPVAEDASRPPARAALLHLDHRGRRSTGSARRSPRRSLATWT